MALRSLRVVELAGLAPVPMVGMMLAGTSLATAFDVFRLNLATSYPDFGANVVRIDKPPGFQPDTLTRYNSKENYLLTRHQARRHYAIVEVNAPYLWT